MDMNIAIPGLKITFPYEALDPGVARVQCEECGKWQRVDKADKGLLVGEIAHSNHAHMTPATILERKRAAAVRRFRRIHAERVAADAPNDRRDRFFNELPHVWFAHRDDESPVLQALITAWRFDSTDHVRFHLGRVPRGSTAAHVAALADDFAYQVHLVHCPGVIARHAYAVVAFTWPKVSSTIDFPALDELRPILERDEVRWFAKLPEAAAFAAELLRGLTITIDDATAAALYAARRADT